MARSTASQRVLVRNLPYSLSLDGSGDYSDHGNNYAFERTDPFSFCGYFLATGVGATNMSLIRKSNTAVSNAQGWAAFINSADRLLTFFLSANSTTNRITQTIGDAHAIKLGVWYFWGISYDGSSTAAGVNFVLVPVGTSLTALAAKNAPTTDGLSLTTVNTQVLRIGASADSVRVFNGLQQKISVFNAALTLAEFQDIYYNNKYPASLTSTWLGEDTEGAGSTISDEVGSIDGTITNATWSISSPFDRRLVCRNMPNSIIFDATSDNVLWADDPALEVSTAMTAEAWVTFHSGQMFASKYGAAGQRSWFMQRVTATGFLQCAVIIGGAAQTVTTTYFIPLNVPFHVVLTYDNTNVIVYVDGREVGRTAATGSIDDSTAGVRLGRSINSADGYSGLMHLFRYWNVAATRAQIQDLYYNDKSFGSPIIEVLMSDGSGTSLTNTGSFGTAGTMTGVDWTSSAPFKTRSTASARSTA